MTQQSSISRLRPVIRIFVSSTFSDLKHERDALQREVFPQLEQFCASWQFQFQAIDLRWGISSEAGDDHRTMRICFDELRRSQEVSPEPNFLILLGNRYGMRPLPEEISQAEYEQLAAAAQFGREDRAPIPGTHGKTALQVLRDWYRSDENVLLPPKPAPDHAPLNYILQPRTQDLHDGRDYTRTNQKQRTYSQAWRDVQQVLRRIIDLAFPVELLDHRFDDIDWPQHLASVNDRRNPRRVIPQIVRFQASATEQEIWYGALSVPNAERHVLAFFRDITNRDDFAPEEARDFYDLTETRGFDEHAAKRQNALRKAIVERLGKDATLPVPYSGLKRESGKVVVDASEADTKAFCDAVFERFRPIIERQIEAYWRNTAHASVDRAARDLEIEQREYERFAEERGGEESFVGRQVELQAILDYVGSDSCWPLVIQGASGCGKTALLARASQEVSKTRKRVERFIGVAPRSSDLRSLLGSLCQELRQRNPRADALPTEVKPLRDEFSRHLQAATPEQPLILFLDALDQLADADNGRLLNWLPPGSLPAHVKLVVSCMSDRATGDPAGQPYAELKRRQIPAENFINLDVLSEAEARLALFDRWLPKAGRKVSDDQRARIEQRLASPACRQPIFLNLLFEEVQLWHSYDPAPMPGENVSALLGQLFDRLSLETNHGPLLVNRVLGYLSASQYGLAENEILEILFADPEYRAKLHEATDQTRHELPPSAKRIPIALWSRLRFDLAPYLTERAAPGANVLTFYHRQVAEWVQEHLVKVSEQGWQPHQRLAEYFGMLARTQDAWHDHRRALVELPFQLTAAARWEELGAALCSFGFLDASFRAGNGDELQSVFESALASWPESSQLELRSRVQDFQSAIRQEANNFRHFSGRTGMMPFQDFLFQQLRNRIYDNSQGAHDPPRTSLTNLGTSPLLLRQHPSAKRPFVHTFDADPGSGILRFGGGKVRFTPDGKHLVVACMRERVPVFDVSRGHETAALDCLGRAWTMDFSDDANKVVVGGDAGRDTTSGFLEVLDLATGESLVGKAMGVLVHGLVVTSYGQVFCCCADRIQVYSAVDLTLIKEWCPYDGSLVYSIAVNRARTLVATGEYHDQQRWARISVWDASTFRCLAQFEGQKYGITALAFSDDDRILASGSNHVASGVVAWNWMLPGTEWDVLLLSQKTPDDTQQRLLDSPRVRTEGRVISTLRTSVLVQSIAFYPRSTWVVAAEGAPDIPRDAIDIFDVLGTQPGPIAKLSGHSSAPVAIDVDPAGKYVASLHADAKLVLWSAASLKTTNIANRADALGSHTVNDTCTLILSQSQDNYRSIRLTDIDAGQDVLGHHTIPCFHAAIDPESRYVARFYWVREPMSPYLGGDAELDEPSKRWWQHFRANTPVQCTLHAIGSLLALGKDGRDERETFATIEFLLHDSGLAQWDIPLGFQPTNLLLAPDGSWGASLLKDQEGLFWLFRFDVDSGKSCVEWLPWKMTECAIFATLAGDHLGIAVVRDKIALRLFNPKAEAMRVVGELTGLGVTAGLTHGPFLLSGNRCLVVRDHQAVSVLGASSAERSPEGDWQVFPLTNECSCKHDSGIRDAAVSRDEQLVVLLDSEPSISIRRLSDLKLICRRALDSKYTTIRISHDGKRLLAIGGDSSLEGASYSLMELAATESFGTQS